MNFSFLEPAQAELDEAVGHYNERRAGLGDELASEAEKTVGKILQYPSISPRISESVRRCRIERFPYAILYQAQADEILIVAFMHLRRDPQYWRNRIPDRG